MKKFFFLFVALSFIVRANAQTVGIGTTNPATSAALDVTSTSKGLLPPRMTLLQRNAISTPAQGLMVYDIDRIIGGEPEFFNGTIWKNMVGLDVSFYPIGYDYLGGKIAYILQPGDPGYIAGQYHGLIASASDQGIGAPWGCYGTDISGAEGTALGTGNQNTIDIVNGCSTAGIAARICNDLELGGYSDWYLPSKDELNKLFLNRVAIGGFINYYYWSSSEFDIFNAWHQYFLSGAQAYISKANSYYVRPVRAF
ncbi:MAG: DUF1566 domain-containing protein [Saprospiraceae bacterium]